jgi:hypothetical protein
MRQGSLCSVGQALCKCSHRSPVRQMNRDVGQRRIRFGPSRLLPHRCNALPWPLVIMVTIFISEHGYCFIFFLRFESGVPLVTGHVQPSHFFLIDRKMPEYHSGWHTSVTLVLCSSDGEVLIPHPLQSRRSSSTSPPFACPRPALQAVADALLGLHKDWLILLLLPSATCEKKMNGPEL